MHPNVSAYRLPTVRQSYLQSGKATYCQASYLLSGMHPNVAAYFAPNNRIHAPNRSIDMHPKGIDMHPKVSTDLHPTSAYFAPKRSRRLAPNFHFQKVTFSKSTIFNCFRFKKSEPHLIYDCIFTVFLNVLPNRFCFNSEPHELV